MINRLFNLKQQLLKKKKSKKGFTMIELIIVIAIIAILVVIAMPYYQSTLASSKVSSAESNIKVIGDATMNYYTEMGTLPDANSITDLRDTLTTKATDPNGETKGPWLKKNMKEKDPWGHDYRYEKSSNTEFDIISDGPDGDSQNEVRYSTLGNRQANQNQ